MIRTLPDKFTPVEEAITDAHLVAWDGCHRIYLAMDQEQAEWFAGNYPEVIQTTPETMLTTVIDWYERSCSLRFINAVTTNHENPNAGYTTLIGQFDDWEDEDTIED